MPSSSHLQRSRAVRAALFALGAAACARVSAQPVADDDSQTILSIDHYLTQVASAPPIAGQHAVLYLRERVRPATTARGADLEGRVVLFVHGAGTPAEVAFDAPGDLSWMAYLAAAGFDAFSVDMTGYGRSTRPHVMNDPCNLSEDAQRGLGIGIALGDCAPSFRGATTTIESDWDDIDAAVDYIRDLRQVQRVHLVGWSLGGPRAGGYAARHEAKVDRLVLLAPAYRRDSAAEPSADADPRAAMSSQSWDDFLDYWNGPAACADQRTAADGAAIFSEMLRSDPVGASWGPGIRRAPTVAVWGWNEAVVRRQQTPLLAIAPAQDASVAPALVRELYQDYGAAEKVLIDINCATHGAMWESVRDLIYPASLEWLKSGTVDGASTGEIRMQY